MPDTIIESVLNGKLDSVLLIKWINNDIIEDDCILNCCKKNEFVAYFLSYLRNQTDSILHTNSNASQILQNSTPEKALSSRRKHHRSISDPTSDDRDTLCVKTEKSHESPNRDRKRPGRRVKTTLFPDDRKENLSMSSDESRLSSSMDRMAISSTPLKNGVKPADYPNLSLSSPVTPRSFIKDGERCDTPRLSHRHSRSHEKSCLGDFLVTATKSSKKKSKKNLSNENEEKLELDLSNSEMFPEIGARKSSSLRGEKKRIKPTNIDKSQKSLSLSSFNSECFQQQSPSLLEENSAFKHQKFQPNETADSFEAERNILKQERHKLMEKFNILNTAPQKDTATPQIKITQKETIEVNQCYVKANVTKILLRKKIDLLIHIYDNLLKNNLILSVITEVYFLISIVISKQLEDDCLIAESKLNDNNIDYILKSIHNSSYFAVKSLWNLRATLEVILDKNSLKTLGENKKVRSFYPDLAKFLLNCYCVRCERPPAVPLRGPAALPPRGPAVVCYNTETDSADNFPDTQAFHNFKKQRDMFYEIVRWYGSMGGGTGTGGSWRARARALAGAGAGAAANHAHLASLFAAHMRAECAPAHSQESKLSKLNRRLTCPIARDSNRLPSFTSSEMFYKEFIMSAEHESFRTHLRDVLSTEIVTLDSTQFAVEDRGNSNNIDLTREYLQLEKKLMLLAKFLGYLTSLPYSSVPVEITKNNNTITINNEHNYVMPKEKVFENSLAMRSYSQPTIDLKGLLQNAIDNSRLSITIPWMVNYLSMLDYTTLHLPYFQNIIKILKQIYHTKLNLRDNYMKKNTIVYLKSILGWLFDLPHCTETESIEASVGTESVDKFDLVDESIFELCPCLRDVNTLLSTCRLSQEQKDIGSFRHITPVSINVDPQARIRNKEKELQNRLEEQLVRSQPMSTRRTLELVSERVCACAVRELAARDLPPARLRAHCRVRAHLAHHYHEDHATLLASVTSIYSTHLQQLRTSALESARAPLASRTRAALTALLPTAPVPLQSVACRAARNKLSNWINDHWNTTAVLCKDIESEMKTLLSLNEMRVPTIRTPTLLNTTPLPTCEDSPAVVLIQLKEHICLVLEESPTDDVTKLMSRCAGAGARGVLCRAPTQRALLQLSVDMCLVYVSRKPNEVTESFLLKLHAIWNTCCPDRKHYTPDNISSVERREDLSPEPRNYTDDRLPTPTTDEENESELTNGIDESIDQNSIGIESGPVGAKTKSIEQHTQISSNTQPISPNSLAIASNSQSVAPNSQPISPNSLSFVSNSQSIALNSLSIAPNSPTETHLVRKPDQTTPKSPVSKLNPKPVTPLKRITPISQPISPKAKFHPTITINTRPIDSNTRSIDSNTKESNHLTSEESNEHFLEYFDRILCPRNIVLLTTTTAEQSEVWEALAIVIVFLLKNDYLGEDSLTEQCLSVYRQDWPQGTLENLSSCMKAVSSKWSRSSSGKFTLFLDFLAEYCGDMDYEITD